MPRFTLSRDERLRSEKAIARLFASGRRFTKYPVSFVWIESLPEYPQQAPVLVLFSAPKKKFPKAVDRNRIKRLLREAYRLAKPDLFAAMPEGSAFHLALIYNATEILSFGDIQKSIQPALERWARSIINTHHPKPSAS